MIQNKESTPGQNNHHASFGNGDTSIAATLTISERLIDRNTSSGTDNSETIASELKEVVRQFDMDQLLMRAKWRIFIDLCKLSPDIHFSHSCTNIRAYGRARLIFIFHTWHSNKIRDFISDVSFLELWHQLVVNEEATMLLGEPVPLMPWKICWKHKDNS